MRISDWSSDVCSSYLDAEDKTLLQIAAELGSDVPACLVSRTLMGTGRGVALEPRAMPDLSGTPLLLVNPRRGLSTPLVFSCWDGQDRGPLQADNLDQIVSERTEGPRVGKEGGSRCR